MTDYTFSTYNDIPVIYTKFHEKFSVLSYQHAPWFCFTADTEAELNEKLENAMKFYNATKGEINGLY